MRQPKLSNVFLSLFQNLVSFVFVFHLSFLAQSCFLCFGFGFQAFSGQKLVLEVKTLERWRIELSKRLKESRRASHGCFGELLVMPWCDHCTPRHELQAMDYDRGSLVMPRRATPTPRSGVKFSLRPPNFSSLGRFSLCSFF